MCDWISQSLKKRLETASPCELLLTALPVSIRHRLKLLGAVQIARMADLADLEMLYTTNSIYNICSEADAIRTIPESCRGVNGSPLPVALRSHVHGSSKDLTAVNTEATKVMQLACRDCTNLRYYCLMYYM